MRSPRFSLAPTPGGGLPPLNLLLVFALALGLRLASAPLFTFAGSDCDGAGYWNVARHIADGQGWLSNSYRFLYVPQLFSNYRFHATSHSNQGWETFMGEWTAVSERHYLALTPFRRRLADYWAGYLRLETAALQRVRAARNA